MLKRVAIVSDSGGEPLGLLLLPAGCSKATERKILAAARRYADYACHSIQQAVLFDEEADGYDGAFQLELNAAFPMKPLPETVKKAAESLYRGTVLKNALKNIEAVIGWPSGEAFWFVWHEGGTTRFEHLSNIFEN